MAVPTAPGTDVVVLARPSISVHVDQFSVGLTGYLTEIGLPADGVLVPVQERGTVLANLASVVGELRPADAARAMYISKFVAACGVGLFDAALNYLWDETIRNLREKVATFDLSYFYNAAIQDTKRRALFSTEADLPDLQDWELIKGCRDTGLVTDIGYRHLDYIRGMRNHASAAHPNQTDLSGFQLLSWLQTCIREVLSKAPSGAVIEVKRLLSSIRDETLTATHAGPVATAMQLLPAEVAVALLRTLFGMYCDPKLGTQVKANMRLVAASLWAVVDDPARYEIGIRHASYSANAEVAKTAAARKFLENVAGLTYLSPDIVTLELSNHLDALLAAHDGFNNFYTEVPVATALRAFVPENGQVPDAVLTKYVSVLTMCRIDNGYGVSRDAQSTYDELLNRWQDRELKQFVSLARDIHVGARLQISACAENYKKFARSFVARAASPTLRNALNYMVDCPTPTVSKLAAIGDFRRLLQAVA